MTQAGNMLSRKLTRHVVATRALLNAISTACSRVLLRDLFDFLESFLLRLWERLHVIALVILLARLAMMEGHIVDGAVTVLACVTCEDVATVAIVTLTTVAASRKTIAVVGVILTEKFSQADFFIAVILGSCAFHGVNGLTGC
jgi:hypothetical protein